MYVCMHGNGDFSLFLADAFRADEDGRTHAHRLSIKVKFFLH